LSDTFAILGTPGFVRDPGRFDDETMLKVLGANSGNLMFQFAATQIIDAPLTHISLAETAYSDPVALRGAKALVFPAANHLRTGVDWTGLNAYLGLARQPLVVLGLGAQSPKIGGESATIAALKADAQVMRMVDILRDKAAFVSVRGAFSQAVCDALGLPDVAVLGCPSALINPDPELGRAMARRLALAASAGAGLKLAVTAAAPFEIREDRVKRDLERRLFGWATAFGGLYVQQSGGVAAMLAANGQWHRLTPNVRRSIAAILAPEMDPVELWAYLAGSGRFYLSVPAWRDEMRGLDLVLGTRLHGNMAAIAAGTPGVIIAHDSRTGELGQTMHLPRLAIAAVMGAGSLEAALPEVEFDGEAFDAWRRSAAATLTAAFDRIAIPVSPHVRALAA